MISESRALVYTKRMNSDRNRWIWSLDFEQNEPFPRKSSSEFDKMLEFDKKILFSCQKKSFGQHILYHYSAVSTVLANVFWESRISVHKKYEFDMIFLWIQLKDTYFDPKPLISDLKINDFHWFPCQNLRPTADTFTAGQVAPPAKAESNQQTNRSDGYARPISLYLTFISLFLCRKFNFCDPKIGTEKKSLKTASTTHGHTHRFELDLEARRTHFRHSKTQIQSRKASNRGPQNDPPILLRTCLIELLRHSFSASRSQSSACGAITKPNLEFARTIKSAKGIADRAPDWSVQKNTARWGHTESTVCKSSLIFIRVDRLWKPPPS